MLSPEVCEAVLKDHYKKPRYHGLEGFQRIASVENPACGDIIELGSKSHSNRILYHFEGRGCAVSQAGASLILHELQKNPLSQEAQIQWLNRFELELREGHLCPEEGYELYEEAAALFMFRTIPSRLSCACLALNLLQQKLNS